MSIRERDWTRGIELRVKNAVTIERMVIDERPIVILNPMRCLPGRTYLVDVNEHSNTGTIREDYNQGDPPRRNEDWPQPNRDPYA